jgi:cytidylate kinase
MVVDTLEKERLTGVEEFIASLVKIKYLYPGSDLRHLMRVVGAIAKHGRAVIVGRGANFLIPEDQRLSVRVIAPLDRRVENVAREFGLKLETARKRVVQREAKRRAFIRESFHTNVDDPMHYDMVINTAKISLDSAVGAIVGALTPPAA